MSHLIAGANFWDAPGHSMAGSNDLATRKEIFRWIAKHEKAFYAPRKPLQPVGVYFSPKSRDYDAKAILALLSRNTRRLAPGAPGIPGVDTKNGSIVSRENDYFPGSECLISGRDQFIAEAFKTKESGSFSWGQVLLYFLTPRIPYDSKMTRPQHSSKGYRPILPTGSKKPPRELLDTLDSNNPIELDAPPTVAANFAMVEGHPTIFLANFTGLEPGKNALPTPIKDIRVRVQK